LLISIAESIFINPILYLFLLVVGVELPSSKSTHSDLFQADARYFCLVLRTSKNYDIDNFQKVQEKKRRPKGTSVVMRIVLDLLDLEKESQAG
jgi:hypothetical protein